MNDFAFATDVRVRFAETDAQGVVNNAVFLVWFEIARIEYLEAVGGGYPALRARGIEAFVIEANVKYCAPVRFDDRLRIHARCSDIRGARFRFDYLVEREGDTVATGWSRHACVDGVTLRPTRVPEWLVEAIRQAG